MKKGFIVALISSCLMSSAVFASSRVDSVISESTSQQLDLIDDLTREIALGEAQLKVLDQDLQIAAQKHPGHEVLLKTRNIAGVTTLVSLATAGVGGLIVQFGHAGPSGPRGAGAVALGAGATVAVISGIVAALSEGGVLLTPSEADQLREEIKNLKSITAMRKKQLSRETEILCRNAPTHELCR